MPGEKDWKKIKSFIEIDSGSGGINLFIAFFFCTFGDFHILYNDQSFPDQ